jgi:exopolyphosphatase / guanosine-5'-triphosphate,3'-diphosphate pyrophosphatase
VRLAALDLGSNSFHVMVVEVRGDGSFETIAREKLVLRLGEVVSAQGFIDDDNVGRAIDAARQLNAIAAAAGAEVTAVATDAFRSAANGEDVADRIAAEIGVPVRILHGLDEAALTFEGVRASVLIDPGPALLIDLGGGSLEVVVGDRTGLQWGRSVNLGASRLTGELLRHDPPTADECRRVRRRVREVLAPLLGEVGQFRPSLMVGSSGTIGALARAVLGDSSVHQATITLDELHDLAPRLLDADEFERARLSGVDQRRAPILPAGYLVVTTAMEAFGFDQITVSDWALREGIILDAIGHMDPAELTAEPRAIRAASVASLLRRCDAPHGHSEHVARLALELFDGLRPVHGLGADDRELLGHASLLHDIGEHVAVDGHERHSAYLVEHGRLRGFTPAEVAMLAALCRFHRRGTPKPSYEAFASLDDDDRYRVTRLVAILRVADALDRSHAGVVRSVSVTVRGNDVALHVEADGDMEVELFGLRRKQELFERVFARRLTVHIAGPTTATAQ